MRYAIRDCFGTVLGGRYKTVAEANKVIARLVRTSLVKSLFHVVEV